MATLVINKDTELFTTVYPNKGKETVILLHGGPNVPEEVGLLTEFLSQEFQVIYFHQRGTLKSPCPSGDFSMASYISDIDSIASHYNLQKFHLFGHSWGGLYAPIYAEQRQDKILSMFLCSPASGTGRQWVEMGKEISRYNRKRSSFFDWLAMNINALLGMLGSTNGYKKLYKQFGIIWNKGFGLNSVAPLMIDHLKASSINRTNKAVLKYPKLQKLTAPGYKITVTYGDDDLYGDSTKHVRERYPTADFITIPGCGHNQWLHNEKEFFSTLAKHYSIGTSA